MENIEVFSQKNNEPCKDYIEKITYFPLKEFVNSSEYKTIKSNLSSMEFSRIKKKRILEIEKKENGYEEEEQKSDKDILSILKQYESKAILKDLKV